MARHPWCDDLTVRQGKSGTDKTYIDLKGKKIPLKYKKNKQTEFFSGSAVNEHDLDPWRCGFNPLASAQWVKDLALPWALV